MNRNRNHILTRYPEKIKVWATRQETETKNKEEQMKLENNMIEIFINKGFEMRKDVCENDFLYHKSGVTIYGNEPCWLLAAKLEAAIKSN